MEISHKFLQMILLQTLILATKVHLKFKMTCSAFAFLQILLAARLMKFLLEH